MATLERGKASVAAAAADTKADAASEVDGSVGSQLQKLLAGAGKGSFAADRALLRFIRTHNVPLASLVIDFGVPLVASYGHRLGDELWSIHEQIFLAALETHQFEHVKPSWDALQKQFPDLNSARMSLLRGRFFEYAEEFESAKDQYNSLLKANPANSLASKRLIAIMRAQGLRAEAMEALGKYLDLNPTDMQAWLELADLYMERGFIKEAMHCFEELVLLNPGSVSFHVEVGECLLALGGATHELQARKHFSHAVNISNSSNPRALLGLAMASARIAERSSDTDNSDLHTLAVSGLEAMYREKNPELLPAVHAALQ